VSERIASGPLPRYLLPDSAVVAEGGSLSVGGVDLVSLAEDPDVGTPVFVYDEQHLRARCREAVTAFGPGVAYASKAFLCKAMADLAYEEGMHIDVASGGEAYVAMRAGVPASHLILHGNNKSDAELVYALERGIGRIVVDSFDEIDRLLRLVPNLDAVAAPKVMVRVTPGVEAHTHEFVMTGQEDTKFGFSLANGSAAEAVLRCRTSSHLDLVGLHAHIGSQIFSTESFHKEIEVLAPFVINLGLPELCVGGGLGVPYVDGEEAPTITQWAQAVFEACTRWKIPEDTKITAEPGRSIVAGAAITLYKVGTIKKIRGVRTYLSVDGGMSDNPRPVLYGSGYEAFLPRATDAERPLVATIVGKHCESGDVLVRDAAVPADVAVGDILATPVTGAYGYSMANNYNKIRRPAVVFVQHGTWRAVVRRENYDDLIRLDL
jgi:diaminopimelate decarboxylase